LGGEDWRIPRIEVCAFEKPFFGEKQRKEEVFSQSKTHCLAILPPLCPFFAFFLFIPLQLITQKRKSAAAGVNRKAVVVAGHLNMEMC
jgi:hypothetical protein